MNDTFPTTDEIRDTDPSGLDRSPAADGVGLIDVAPPIDPPPELVDAVVRYYNAQRAALLNKVADIETLLGFIAEDAADKALAVRVAKLEAFCGLKG